MTTRARICFMDSKSIRSIRVERDAYPEWMIRLLSFTAADRQTLLKSGDMLCLGKTVAPYKKGEEAFYAADREGKTPAETLYEYQRLGAIPARYHLNFFDFIEDLNNFDLGYLWDEGEQAWSIIMSRFYSERGMDLGYRSGIKCMGRLADFVKGSDDNKKVASLFAGEKRRLERIDVLRGKGKEKWQAIRVRKGRWAVFNNGSPPLTFINEADAHSALRSIEDYGYLPPAAA